MGRMRGCLWLAAGLMVALVAGFVAFTALNNATRVRSNVPGVAPEVDVVVAAQAVPVRAVLTLEDLQVKKVPVTAAPEGSVASLSDAEGMITLVELYPGEIILSQRLLEPNVAAGSGRLALVVSADEVLMAFPAEDLMSRINVLKPGDHVDLLFTLEFPTDRGAGAGQAAATQGEVERVTFSLLQNLTIAAVVGQTTTEQGTHGGGSASAVVHHQPTGCTRAEVHEGCRGRRGHRAACARRGGAVHGGAGGRGLRD